MASLVTGHDEAICDGLATFAVWLRADPDRDGTEGRRTADLSEPPERLAARNA